MQLILKSARLHIDIQGDSASDLFKVSNYVRY
jgi:hypothetical protein